MKTRKWFDASQPQTLQAAAVLCYLNAALALLTVLLSLGSSGSLISLILLTEGVAAYGIANSKHWGYWLAVVAAALYVVVLLTLLVLLLSLSWILNLLFAVVLLVLLLHPMSRSYQKIWFG